MTDDLSNGASEHGPKDQVYDPLNPVWINTCSGQTEAHNKGCDGNCDRRPVTELEIKIFNEYNAWARAGMDPRMIQVDLVDNNIKIRALSRILEKELDISVEQQDIHYQEFKLEYLTNIRLENQERVRKEKMQSLIPKRQPLLGPDGRPFGFG